MSNHFQQISNFITHLRSIDGLYYFKIFSKYKSYASIGINPLFNSLAERESEEDLRELERMWIEFNNPRSVNSETIQEHTNDSEKQKDE